MHTIYKYTLRIVDEQVVEMPLLSRVLSAHEQNGKLCLWAAVLTGDDKTEKLKVRIIGTGNPIPDGTFNDYRFLATVPMSNGLVWHVFIRQPLQR